MGVKALLLQKGLLQICELQRLLEFDALLYEELFLLLLLLQ